MTVPGRIDAIPVHLCDRIQIPPCTELEDCGCIDADEGEIVQTLVEIVVILGDTRWLSTWVWGSGGQGEKVDVSLQRAYPQDVSDQCSERKDTEKERR